MKISEKTLNILNYFAKINDSIYIKKGSVISTLSNARTILASAKVEEEFPANFGVYNLRSFLNTVSLFEEPDIAVQEDTNYCTISSNKNEARYILVDPEVIVHPPKDSISLDNIVLRFKLTETMLTKLLKSQRVSGLKDLLITNKNGSVYADLVDTSNTLNKTFSFNLETESPSDASFEFYVHMDNLEIIPANYNVSISFGDKRFIHFQDADQTLNYWIVLETKSKYEKV